VAREEHRDPPEDDGPAPLPAALLQAVPAGGRVAVLGPAAAAQVAALARQGLAATGLAGSAAELLAAAGPDGPFDAVLLPRDFADEGAEEAPALLLRLLGRARRWLRPGGLLLWERAAPEAPAFARRAGFHPRPAAPGGWTVASAGTTPPQGLAVATHHREGDVPRLDLRWCPDEGEWLDPSPADLWSPLWRRDPAALAAAAGHYAVDDPYGAARSAATVAAHFGCPLAPAQITWSAGTSALLYDLVHLAHGGPVLAPALAHPDLAAWATASGVTVHPLAEDAPLADWHAAVRRLAPGLVHLDRPGVAGRRLPLDELAALAATAAAAGAIVLVDEAYGSYFAGAGSAVVLVDRLPNLVVLRSLSKAYMCGGLRAGFAVASPAMAAEVRERVAPLGTAELSFQMALALLAAGDLFARLRARVREVKPRMIAALERLGLTVWPGEAELPWVLLADAGGRAWQALAARGVAGKRLGLSPLLAAAAPACFRLSVPLSPERVAQWEESMSAPPGPEGGGIPFPP
jgi:histidinol-phosphate/aromatic aminotransferase/cobyric acid decarboxylase-like protein